MAMRTTQHDLALNPSNRHRPLSRFGLGLITIATLVAVVDCTFPREARATPGVPDLTITVRVYNYAQTPLAILAEAEREAGRILSEAGLKSTWLDCPIVPTDTPQNACTEPSEAADVRLRVLSEPTRNIMHDNAYGFAIMPALASVYSEAALRFARNDEGEFEVPIVLACAIAHEIGHLLLGANSHAISGIMCAHWERKQIQQALMGALLFSPGEARLMRAEMRKRRTS